jgi:hypothetical protein
MKRLIGLFFWRSNMETKIRGAIVIGLCLLAVIGFAISGYLIVANTLKLI